MRAPHRAACIAGPDVLQGRNVAVRSGRYFFALL
jgi:hypothetical protein